MLRRASTSSGSCGACVSVQDTLFLTSGGGTPSNLYANVDSLGVQIRRK